MGGISSPNLEALLQNSSRQLTNQRQDKQDSAHLQRDLVMRVSTTVVTVAEMNTLICMVTTASNYTTTTHFKKILMTSGASPWENKVHSIMSWSFRVNKYKIRTLAGMLELKVLDQTTVCVATDSSHRPLVSDSKTHHQIQRWSRNVECSTIGR